MDSPRKGAAEDEAAQDAAGAAEKQGDAAAGGEKTAFNYHLLSFHWPHRIDAESRT